MFSVAKQALGFPKQLVERTHHPHKGQQPRSFLQHRVLTLQGIYIREHGPQRILPLSFPRPQASSGIPHGNGEGSAQRFTPASAGENIVRNHIRFAVKRGILKPDRQQGTDVFVEFRKLQLLQLLPRGDGIRNWYAGRAVDLQDGVCPTIPVVSLSKEL